MRIIYFDLQKVSVSGGHLFNDNFLKVLSSHSGESIITTPKCAELYPSWRKLFSPFLELRRLKLLKKGSLVFWGDTTYKHHFLLAIFAKLFMNVHSAIIIHHFLFIGNTGLKKYISFILQYIYISLLDDIIVPSPFTLDIAKKYFPSKSIYYVPLPFCHNFNASIDYEKGNLLYVGTIDERKGLGYLIDALEIAKKKNKEFKFKLNVVGKITDSNYYNYLIDKINKIGQTENVHFWGRVSNEILEERYNRAEVFVFPSLLEGYGIVLIEAMSKGLPIVAFNNSAIPYTIYDGENGLLAENKDSVSFANKLLSIFGNKQLRDHLQSGMKQTIRDLKTQDDFEKAVKLYYDTVQSYCKS